MKFHLKLHYRLDYINPFQLYFFDWDLFDLTFISLNDRPTDLSRYSFVF